MSQAKVVTEIRDRRDCDRRPGYGIFCDRRGLSRLRPDGRLTGPVHEKQRAGAIRDRLTTFSSPAERVLSRMDEKIIKIKKEYAHARLPSPETGTEKGAAASWM